ncbi:DNA cytosine methyltransferase [Tritonibacter mobilis]|uniref:DNA cytosine methyltransferase n=1 Tax=Tritonibacter mobilis TaxID=379347 RepID=UPI000B54EDC4|nr:DNA cytosine methyltransferase [Tritonibacter mobilis]ANH49072.1 putative C-5 cytosine-specific DNA methylase [Ruegeria phage 45A6]
MDVMTAPMIIDSFAGGGGASTGIEMALGCSPDIAINHNAAALALHAANHPDTLHLDSNIWDVDPREVTQGRPVGLLWASPDCKHFSKAKGGAVRDRNDRDLAWVVVKWAEDVKPAVICMENVEEFVTWGPVGEDGQPIKEFAGMTYELWLKRLKAAGYKVQSRELRACDYGAPTIRKRWFLVARRDGQPIVWPKPTHGDPNSAAVRKGRLKPWRTAAKCIDWTIPCPSIFDTSEEIKAKHGLRAIRPLARNTMARVARGMKRYVLEAESPFLVSLKGTARRDSSAHAPHPTVLAEGGHSALVVPSITRFNGGATGQDMRDPLATITANSWIKKPGGAAPLGMVTPYLASIAHGDSGGRREYPLVDPLGTVTGRGVQHAVVTPILTYAQHGGANRAPDAPMHTICASKKDQNSLIAASMIHVGNGERPGQAPRVLDISAPLNTVVAGGVKQYPVAAFLAQQNGGPRMGAHAGHDIGNPISTIAASGSHQTPVAAFFAKYYGTGDGATTSAPMHTVTVKDRFAHTQVELAPPPFAPEHEERARQVAVFLREHDAWDGGELVTLEIEGDTFVVIDIGLRMLTPRELFRAQGFPDDYVIEGVWEIGSGWENLGHNGGPRFVPFSKNVQISCCGNSVCPDIAAAIVGANCSHLIEKRSAA